MPETLDPRSVRYLQGFGAVSGGAAYVLRPQDDTEVFEAFELARRTSRKVVLRGAGRSYGDPAFLAESIAIELSNLSQIEDLGGGLFRLGAGATLEALWKFALPRGYWLPVVSGTAKPTLGGALAANIHGKNAFKAGTLGEHVVELGVILPSGGSRVIKPNDELFWAVIGGMGLVGVITSATLLMHPVSSAYLNVYAEAIPDWETQFRVFEAHRHSADYMVSWVDMTARGRGLFHSATYDPDPSGSDGAELAASWTAGKASRLPDLLRLLNNRLGVRFINWAKSTEGRLRHHRKAFRQSLPEFQFLLDQLPSWERMYAPSGFYQVQVFVPEAAAPSVFPQIEDLCHRAGQEPNLAVLKLHKPTPQLLSYCTETSFSLAMDFRNTGPQIQQLAGQIYDLALNNCGHVYLAKDQLLSSTQYLTSLGQQRLDRFIGLRRQCDPCGLLTSSQADRLELTTHSAPLLLEPKIGSDDNQEP